MKYDPIEVEIDGKAIRYFFLTKEGKRWFYDTSIIKNEKEAKDWDIHLSRKMWYTKDIREKTMELMKKIYE